ncbi:hypothetical protein ABIC63_000656 [Pseudacidovorax sp. 1753]|uniref:DUF3106 domain-containing protein n=1 Tax=Pseudacidovorax sp. 1753 TaxID=3156419 RepID=UPI003393C4B4
MTWPSHKSFSPGDHAKGRQMLPKRNIVALILAAMTVGAGSVAVHAGESGPAAGSIKSAAQTRSGPRWTTLTKAQQQALAPLAPHWNTLSDAQRRKWIALSRNFDHIGPAEQAKLHERMTDWAALSPRQRALARLNFAEVRNLAPAEQLKAKWEAYQALSEAERRKLAESAGGRSIGAAPAARPVPADKLVPVPATAFQQPHGGPRIQITPSPGPEAANAAPIGDATGQDAGNVLMTGRPSAEPTATAP